MFCLLLSASLSVLPIQEGGRSGVPLGGLGTGSVELTLEREFGRMRFSGQEKEPLYAWTPGERGLEGRSSSLPGALVAVWTENEGGILLCGSDASETLITKPSSMRFNPSFPAATIACRPSDQMEIDVTLVGSIGLAMTPGGTEDDGKMPGFLILFSAENRGDSAQEVAFCFSWKNITNEMGRFSNAGLLVTPIGTTETPLEGILQTCHTDVAEESRPELVMAVLKGEGDQVTRRLSWNPDGEEMGFFSDFAKDGALEAEGEGYASALALRCRVAPKSSLWRPFALCWTCPSLCPLLEGGPRGEPRYLRLFGRADDVALRLLSRAADLELGDRRSGSPWTWLFDGRECPLDRKFLLGSLAPLVRNTLLLDEEGLVVRRSAFEVSPVEADAEYLVPAWRLWVSLFPETMGEWIENQFNERTSGAGDGFWVQAGRLQWRMWTGAPTSLRDWRDDLPEPKETPFLGAEWARSWVLTSVGSTEPANSARLRQIWEERVLSLDGLPMDDSSNPIVSQPDLWNSLFASQMIAGGRPVEGLNLLQRILNLKSIHEGYLGGARVYAGRRRLLPLLNRESATTTAPWEAVWTLTGCLWSAEERCLFLRPLCDPVSLEKNDSWSFPFMTPFLRGRSEHGWEVEKIRLSLESLWTPEGEGLDVRRIELQSPPFGPRLDASAELQVDGVRQVRVKDLQEGKGIAWEGEWSLGGAHRSLVLTAPILGGDRRKGTDLSPLQAEVACSAGKGVGDLSVNCGGGPENIGAIEWKEDRPYELGSWGYVGGCTVDAQESSVGSKDMRPLLETRRAGLFSYLVCVVPGVYQFKVCLPQPSGDGDPVFLAVNGNAIHGERLGLGDWMLSEPVAFQERDKPAVISFEAPKGIGAFRLEEAEP